MIPQHILNICPNLITIQITIYYINNSESLGYFFRIAIRFNYKKSGGKLRKFRYSSRKIVFSTQTWQLTKKILPDLVKVNWNNNNIYYNY